MELNRLKVVLYEQSTHPKTKGGEFYTVYFKDCIIDGETADAVGLFKSENKDTFLKIFPSGEGFEIESQQGININKLDNKADQVDLLNKSVRFFKENDNFNMAEFTNKVIGQPEIINSFNQYKSSFQQDYDVEIADNFAISESAVKKQARSLKSVIKLDKNFHIYIHGDRELIEQGEDKKGKFYKVYYEEES